MNKQQQKEWVIAFIALWEATAPHSHNNFADTGNLLDGLTEVFTDFCEKYNLPKMSADELLAEDIWDQSTAGEVIDLNKMFQYKDKTGRGFKAKMPLSQIMDMDSQEVNWDGDSLHTWAIEAEEGDEWENAASKFTCLG